jgi:hypothetical protein
MDVREILHWLVDAVSVPAYERAGAPDPGQVREAIDEAHGYTPPEPALTPEEADQLAALQAKAAQVDAAKAEAKATEGT